MGHVEIIGSVSKASHLLREEKANHVTIFPVGIGGRERFWIDQYQIILLKTKSRVGLSVLRRGKPILIFKNLFKMTAFVIPDFSSNFLKGKMTIFQQLLRPVHPIRSFDL